ncbi:hypothetical protein Vadar_004282 [Vaccinium darrowii]|uniref:Uncharacterized protein n=1 Tax=Vaccinium darrowii TaxID=229202 RepID=A0ACB7XFD5_9ERIC|nr:hypothetical protein Vadar_004282 [Vaccinium darrowii]
MSTVDNSTNIFWHKCPVGKHRRQKIINRDALCGSRGSADQGCVVWITRLSGLGWRMYLVTSQTRLRAGDNQLWSGASVSYSEASLTSGVDNKLSDGQGDGSSNCVGDLPSSTVACFSTELIEEKHAVENLEESGELPKDLGSMDSNVVESLRSVKRVEPLSQEDDMKVDSKLAHQSECLTSAGNESALNVGLEKTILAMDDAVDGASLLSGTGATADKGSDHLDKNTKTGGEASEDTNLLKDVSHGTSNLASGIEESVKSLHKENDHLSPMVETFNTTSGNEQVAKAHEISQTYSFKLEVCLTLSDSAVKEGSCAERLLIPGNCEEAAMRKNHEVAPSKAAGVGSCSVSVFG